MQVWQPCLRHGNSGCVAAPVGFVASPSPPGGGLAGLAAVPPARSQNFPLFSQQLQNLAVVLDELEIGLLVVVLSQSLADFLHDIASGCVGILGVH